VKQIKRTTNKETITTNKESTNISYKDRTSLSHQWRYFITHNYCEIHLTETVTIGPLLTNKQLTKEESIVLGFIKEQVRSKDEEARGLYS
jgi:hypothetical protein